MSVYKVERNEAGYPIAISRDGYYVIHLNPSERTCKEIGEVVANLNIFDELYKCPSCKVSSWAEVFYVDGHCDHCESDFAINRKQGDRQ